MSDNPTLPTAPKAGEDKKTRVLTMTLPINLVQSIENDYAELAMTAGDAVKHILMMAYTHPQGVHLKLQRIEPTAAADAGLQPELPLGTQA